MNGQENQISNVECPDIELLSAWFDGEENLSDAQKEHIKTCSACARRLADYKGICTGMKKEFTCQDLNNEMTERILSQTRCMIRKQIDTVKLERQAKMRKRIIWGIRIGLLLLAIVLFTLLMIREKRSKTQAPVRSQPMAIRGPAFSAFKVPRKLRAYQTPDAFSSSVSSIELALGSDMFCVFDGESRFNLEVPVYIPSGQTQFWFCTSFSASRLSDHAAELKKTIGLKKLDVKTSDKPNEYQVMMDFEGNARQFAVFIKQLRARGLTQLNITQPRCERNFFSGDGEIQIDCRLFVFIPKDGGKYILPVK